MVQSLRSYILYLMLSILVGITACSDTSTNSDTDGEKKGDPVEPSVTINNPDEGGILEGEITFSVTGEAENGFDEARIYLGEKLVETVSDPTLPYEQTIATYEFDNGDYSLKAELDVTDPDTTISVDVSVTLENYMVVLETDGFFQTLKDGNKEAFLFIADPDGNVLKKVDVSQHNDGVLKLLPPEELESGAPDSYSFTVGRVTIDALDRAAFYLDTNVELEPWTRIYRSGSASKDPGNKKDLTVELTNFDQLDQAPMYTAFQSTEYIDDENIFYWDHYFEHPDPNTLTETIQVAENSEDLVITHTPDPTSGINPRPLYLWEDNLASLSGSVSYDVTKDFTPMVAHSVQVPSNVRVSAYAYFMTIAPNSFERGDVDFAFWPVNDVVNADSSGSGLGMWVPKITERSFITYFDGYEKGDPGIRYRHQSAIGGFPDKFPTLAADVDITNPSLDNVQFKVSGSPDYFYVNAVASSNSYYHGWRVFLPPHADSFVFPKIAESLNQSVANYNRASFDFSSVIMTDVGAYNGYSDYMADWFGTADFDYVGEFTQTIKTLTSPSQKIRSNNTSKRDRRAVHPGVPYKY